MLNRLARRLRALIEGKPPERREASEPPDVALVLSGGGARSAYQAGVLRYIAERFPEARFSIMTGVSAGAINAAHLANHHGSFEAAAARLVENWKALTTDRVFEAESGLRLLWTFLRGRAEGEAENGEVLSPRGLVDTAPLRHFLAERLHAPEGELTGVTANLDQGRLKALALTATNYGTGQSVSFVQGCDITAWERPNRISVNTRLTIDHVMASASLPLVFPAVKLRKAWYGDGGIRLSAPLAPAIHLGADRLLAISTRYHRSHREARRPATKGYPPAAQIIGMLMNAVFLDSLDQDALTLRRINELIDELPPGEREGMRPVRMLTLRPSVDIGRLSGEYEATLPSSFRFLTLGLGTDQTRSPDWLSMLLFERDYISRLIDIGYRDARRQSGRIAAFLERRPPFEAQQEE